MGDLEKEIGELSARAAHNRYQFLKAELQTCFTALDMGKFELSIGNVEFARREMGIVEQGVRTIERFFPGVSQEQRTELEVQLAELKAALGPVKQALSLREVDDSSRM